MDHRPKKVSKKKIVFVQLDEELTTLFDRIQKFPYKEIYLVVPKRAVLLQSVVNLKILKQKLEDIGKEMALITDDANGMKLAHQAEIRVFDHWNLGETVDKDAKKDVDSALLKPIAATSNELSDDMPSRLPKKKSSIFEVVRDNQGKEKGFSLGSYIKAMKKNRFEKENFQIVLPGGTKRFIAALLIVSIAVFAVIAYVALPGATINIEPASNVVSRAVNINLVPNPSEPKSLESFTVTASVEFTISHNSSGILSEGADASGNLTIFNESNQDWPLITQTRFQTDEGLVFRIQEGVTVPRASGDTPGTLVVRVIADDLDVNNVSIGSRGNISASRFFIPGLNENNQKVLYAESYEDFTGGTTDVSAIVLEEDLLAANEKLDSQLREKALSALRKEVLSVSSKKGMTLALLEDRDVIQYSNSIIDLPYELLGLEMESFEVSGNLNITGIAYNSDALLDILSTELFSSITPGKQLVRIDADSVSINVFEADNSTKNYKFTATLQGIEEYEIDPELEGGSILSKKIKEHIAGKTIDEAESYIQSLTEVNKVEINIWPVWSPTIPTLLENIKIKSLSKADVIELEE